MKVGITDDDTNALIDHLKQTCCAQWSREDIAKDKLLRFAQAYLLMARAHYRPRAPGDGCGNINLSADELADRERLFLEAVHYSAEFSREEDGHNFWIGCSNFSTNRAFVLCIEAARLLSSGSDGNTFAIKLLNLALSEIGNEHPRK